MASKSTKGSYNPSEDIPPFLKDRKMQHPGFENADDPQEKTEKKNDGSFSDPEDFDDGDIPPFTKTTAGEPQQSFWDRFKPPIMGQRRTSRMKKKTGEAGFSTRIVSLLLLALLVFVVLQQISVGGIRVVTSLAAIFILPYLLTFLFLDLRSYWDLVDSWKGFLRQYFNPILGPGIVSLAISACIFSAPLEGKVWIIGNKTTGTYGTMYAIPLASKITSIPQFQDVVMDVSGRTADGIMVDAKVLATIVCCTDNSDQIIGLYGGAKAKPEQVIKNYLIGVFDSAFKQSVRMERASNIRVAYANMARSISKKQMREESALLWNGKFTVLDSHANLPKN